MAKVGIFTIFDETNIGNRLQNLALQLVLEGLGHDVATIRNTPFAGPVPPAATATNAPAAPPRSKLEKRVRWVLSLLAGLAREDGRHQLRRELMRHALIPPIQKFNARHVVQDHRHVTSLADGQALAESYDVFVAGSDQIWHPLHRGGCPNDFLAFAEPDQRVAYAASFGLEEIPDSFQEHFATMLSGVTALSVRERAGRRIVKELTGRDCPVVLDPTLLVDASEWSTLADEAVQPASRPHVATYLLDDSAPAHMRMARRFARSHGRTIVDILNPACLAGFGTDPSSSCARSVTRTMWSRIRSTPSCSP